MNNQLLAKVLFTNGLATKDQIQKYWSLASDSLDIAAVLRDNGVMAPEVYTQVMAFVARMETQATQEPEQEAPPPPPPTPVSPAPAPASAPPPPSPSPAAGNRGFGLGKIGLDRSAQSTVPSPPPSSPVETEVAVSEFALEGNNPYGEGFHEEAKDEVSRIEGFQDTRIFDFRASNIQPEPESKSKPIVAKRETPGIPPKDWVVHKGDGNLRMAAPLVPGPQAKLEGLLILVRKKGYSDLYLSTGNPVCVRKGLAIQMLGEQSCSQADVRKFLGEALSFAPAALSLDQEKNLRIGISVPGVGRFRMVLTWTSDGPSLAFHAIPITIPNWQDLGIPDFCREWLPLRQGLILLGGTSGSGCTTTARWFAQEAQQNRNCLLQVISEPIEFLWENGLSLFFEPGLHGLDKQSLIHNSIERGDGILVIENIQKSEEFMLAIEAAESGHLVFATMESNDILDMFSRFLVRFSPQEQLRATNLLARSLHGILCQQLLPSYDPDRPIAAFDGLTVNVSVTNLIRKQEFGQIRTLMAGMKGQAVSMEDSIRRLTEQNKIRKGASSVV